jgi:PPOX class probable F420-dependent enzyme
VVPVCFTYEGGAIYSAIDDKPKRTRELRRLRNVRENPQASLVIDEWDEDWSRLRWVIVEGRADVLTEGAEFGRAIDQLLVKYEQYRAMRLDRTRGAVVRLAPDRIVAWRADEARVSARRGSC